LPFYLDYLRESADIQADGSRAAVLYENRRGDNEDLKNKTVEQFIKLGNRDKALHTLLEISPETSISYRDALMACVTAAAMSPQTFQHTVKVRSYRQNILNDL